MDIPVFTANSVDPDQMPHSVASDLGLHCLPMSLLWDVRHKWVIQGTYTTSVTSCLLSCTPIPFRKGVFSKRSKLFPFRADPLSESRQKMILRVVIRFNTILFILQLCSNLFITLLLGCKAKTM